MSYSLVSLLSGIFQSFTDLRCSSDHDDSLPALLHYWSALRTPRTGLADQLLLWVGFISNSLCWNKNLSLESADTDKAQHDWLTGVGGWVVSVLMWSDPLTRKGRLRLPPICQTVELGVLLRAQIDGLGWHYELLIMSIWSLNYTNIINHQTFQTCYNHAQPPLQRYLCQLKSCQWAIIL